MAIGAPLGVLLERYLGWSAIGAATFALMTASLLLAMKKVDVPLLPGVKIGFYKVLASVTPYGLCLAAGATGYGVITAFIALFYASRGWPDPALAFTVMGISFVAARLLFGNAITRLGGFNVALISLTTEIAGLVLLWQASSPALALLGVTLVGFGFSQVFPAVGVEVVKLVPLSSRGAALGTYNLFMDMSLAIVGPLAGLVAGGFGYAAVFLASAVMVLIALAGVARLKVASRECR
jgi:predicted MFS family arabinose efflux permease